MAIQEQLAGGRPVGAIAVALAVALACVSPASAQGVIPQSTQVFVRLIDAVDSETAGPNREYKATVDDAVVVGGVTVLAAGTPAMLQVLRVADAGRVHGATMLALRIVAFEVDGRRVEAESGDAIVSSAGQSKKVAKSAAIAGAAGAILGGLLGGKKGAAQGLAAGAAAGTAYAAVTGQKIKVSPETRMSFEMSRDVTIR
jgi:hypothetical protein